MAKIQLDGSISVKELRKRFKEALGLSLRVYVGNNAGKGAVKAEETQKLSELADEKKIKKGSVFEITPGMTVADFEKTFQAAFDIAVQVADGPNKKLLNNDAVLLAPAELASNQGVY
jgi:hypothetical protein